MNASTKREEVPPGGGSDLQGSRGDPTSQLQAAAERGARFFVLSGGDSIADLLGRAAAHGTTGRVVAYRRPHPGLGVYGIVELLPEEE